MTTDSFPIKVVLWIGTEAISKTGPSLIAGIKMRAVSPIFLSVVIKAIQANSSIEISRTADNFFNDLNMNHVTCLNGPDLIPEEDSLKEENQKSN